MRPQRLRAPEEDGALLAVPALADVGNLLDVNRTRFTKFAGDILGRSWSEMRQQARASAVEAAVKYLHESGEPVPAQAGASLVLAGHQPELVHPGVWVKNFALSHLARQHQLTPLHLVVDNDTAKSNVLRLPTADRDGSHVRLEALPFDHWPGDVPYEERVVVDEALFATLAERGSQALAVWGYEPLLPAFWAEVMRQVPRTRLLGERFAAARRSFERCRGCHNLEVPVSRICQTEPFAWFACHLLANLPRLHTIYNDAVQTYRRLHKIRSRNHPVPDLARDGAWFELPLWAWRGGETRRGRPFVRFGQNSIEMRVNDENWLRFSGSEQPASLVAAWQALEKNGLKLRSRALTNTLYARLFLADVFVHGIGGAKYDELTDEIMRQFYGIEPPEFVVLSATLRLPIALPSSGDDDCRRLKELVRDLQYNPQRHLSERTLDPDPIRLVGEKQAWINTVAHTPHQRRARFRVLRRLNDQLRPFIADEEGNARLRWLRVEDQQQAQTILGRRDYASCVYSEGGLRNALERFFP